MAQKKQIKKKFLQVKIPLLNKEIELYSKDIKSLDKKNIKLDLTHELKGRAIELKLIVEADENQATANPIQLKLMTFYLKRVMRKGIDYAEDSFITQCEDYKIKIKPFMITRKRVTRKTLKGLRELAKKEIIEYTKDKSFDHIVLDIINNKLQKELSVKLKKIYPLALCEIKYFGIIDKK